MDTVIRSTPVDMGQPGRRQTEPGCSHDGHLCAGEHTSKAGLAFTGPGTKQGLSSPNIPAANRAGAFQMDASVMAYTGNDHDAGGPTQDFKLGNRVPSGVPHNEGAL